MQHFFAKNNYFCSNRNINKKAVKKNVITEGNFINYFSAISCSRPRLRFHINCIYFNIMRLDSWSYSCISNIEQELILR